ncbi:molybdenum cofactor biosynthesis protein MoaE [Candidatus Bathyarchaeota archaeon]|nr:molybdenum cofactor biosynthesis protein MoaE [Candidatus Bathyarchaeota archaeon]
MDEIINRFKSNPRFDEVGAIISFTGVVKGVSRDGEKLDKIDFEMDREATERRLREIANEFEKRKHVLEVSIHMNAGELYPGEILSHIALATTCDGPEVGEMFKALHEILETIKRTAGIRLKEKSEKGWYYTKPKDKTKTFD